MASSTAWCAYRPPADGDVVDSRMSSPAAREESSHSSVNAVSDGLSRLVINQTGSYASGDNAASRGAQIEQGNNNQNHLNIYLDSNKKTRRAILDEIGCAGGAAWYDDDKEYCVPGTRQALLTQVQTWIQRPEPMGFWLEGLAGTGKSTIARTVAREVSKTNQVASFFFRRNQPGRDSPSLFVRTVAYQLVEQYEDLALPLIEAWDNTGTGPKTLKKEWQQLIRNPLLAWQSQADATNVKGPIVLIVDAIDESTDIMTPTYDMFDFLTDEANFVDLSIRIFVTGRPLSSVESINFHDVFYLHRIEESVVEEDLIKYFEVRFGLDRPDHLGFPGVDHIKELAALCKPLFITARTCYEFIANCNAEYEEQYNTLMQFHKSSRKSSVSKTTRLASSEPESKAAIYSVVDEMYMLVVKHVLSQRSHRKAEPRITDRALGKFREIIGTLTTLREGLSCDELAALLSIPVGSVKHYLYGLRAVVDISTESSRPISVFHQSFPDFLKDQGRVTLACEHEQEIDPEKLWVDETRFNASIFEHCLEIMQVPSLGLQNDICGVLGPGFPASEIPKTTLEAKIPPVLRYACKHWLNHFVSSKPGVKSHSKLLNFLETHLLHWLEAMSCLQVFNSAVGQLDTLHRYLREITPSNTPDGIRIEKAVKELVTDARRVVAQSKDGIVAAPLQVYSSALLFAPELSIVRRSFDKSMPAWIKKRPRMEAKWEPKLFKFGRHVHEDRIVDMRFSADGQRIASLDLESRMNIYDTTTGALLGEATGVTCFDGTNRIDDQTSLVTGDIWGNVSIWPEMKREMRFFLPELKGRMAKTRIIYVKCSEDGRCVAAVDQEGASMVWNWSPIAGYNEQSSAMGPVLTNLKYFADGMLDFSLELGREQPWGRYLATIGRGRHCVRVWRCRPDGTCMLHHDFQAEPGQIGAIALVGPTLFSLSESPAQLRVWSIDQKNLVKEMPLVEGRLRRHKRRLQLLALPMFDSVITPDGQDSARRYNTFGPAEGSIGMRVSSGFHTWATSPDGQMFASYTESGKLGLWSTRTGEALAVWRTETDQYPLCLCFSPDAMILAETQFETICLHDCDLLRRRGHEQDCDDTAHSHTEATVSQIEKSAISQGFSLSPDGRYVAKAVEYTSWNGGFSSTLSSVKVWDNGGPDPARVLRVPKLPSCGFRDHTFAQVIFSPDSCWLIVVLQYSGRASCQLGLWSVEFDFVSGSSSTMLVEGTLPELRASPTIAFSTDSKLVGLCTVVDSGEAFRLSTFSVTIKGGRPKLTLCSQNYVTSIGEHVVSLSPSDTNPREFSLVLYQTRFGTVKIYAFESTTALEECHVVTDFFIGDMSMSTLTYSHAQRRLAALVRNIDRFEGVTLCTWDTDIKAAIVQTNKYTVPSAISDHAPFHLCSQSCCLVSSSDGVFTFDPDRLMSQKCYCSMLPVSALQSNSWVHWKGRRLLHLPRSFQSMQTARNVVIIWDKLTQAPMSITIDPGVGDLVMRQSEDSKVAIIPADGRE